MNVYHKSLFKNRRNAVSGHLFPPMLRWFDLKSARIPASNRLARQKNLPQSGTPPDFKQALRKTLSSALCCWAWASAVWFMFSGRRS
jgi:hypothetical protein